MRAPQHKDIFVNIDDSTGEVMYYVANALPSTIKGMVCEDCGEPVTVINANCSYEEQKKAFKHEREHLKEDDFHTDKKADKLEKERH